MRCNKGEMEGTTAGLIIALIMGVIVAGTIISNVNTDTILGSSTTAVSGVITIVMVAFTLAAVGTIAIIGSYIIRVFS